MHRFTRGANPRRAFVKRLWQRLDAELPVPSRGERVLFGVRRVAIGLAIALPVLVMSTGAYAYGSASVTEESVLYPVKHSIERVEASFARTPDDRAAYHVRMYQRRLEETERLLRRDHAVRETLDAAMIEEDTANTVLERDDVLVERREKHREDLQRLRVRYEMLRDRVSNDGAQR